MTKKWIIFKSTLIFKKTLGLFLCAFYRIGAYLPLFFALLIELSFKLDWLSWKYYFFLYFSNRMTIFPLTFYNNIFIKVNVFSQSIKLKVPQWAVIIRTVFKDYQAVSIKRLTMIKIGNENDLPVWKIDFTQTMRLSFEPITLNDDIWLLFFPILFIIFVAFILF